MANTQVKVELNLQNNMSAGLASASNSVKQFGDNAKQSLSTIASNAREVGIGITALGAGMTALFVGIGKSALTESARFEQTKVSFTTMLGSAEKSQALLKELTDFAARTPFTLPGVESSAKQLMAMGIEQEKILPTLKSLGDVSAGLSVPLEQVALAYGQVRSAGQLYGTEARQFIQAGIPIWDEVAKVMQVPIETVKELGEQGGISFEIVEKAFQNMSGEGGRFNNLMIEQSKTLNGLLSNMSDNFTLLARDIGDQLLPYAKDLAKAIMPMLENTRNWVKENPQLTAQIVAVGTGLGLVVTAIGGLLIALPTIISTFEAVAAVAGAIFAPEILAIGAVVAVVFGGLIAAVYGLYTIWTNNMWGIRDAVIEVWGIIQTEFAKVWEAWAPLFTEAWTAMSQVVVAAIMEIKSYLDQHIPGWKDKFVEGAKVWIPAIADAIIKFKDTMLNWIKETMPKVQEWVNFIKEKFEIFKTVYLPIITEAWEIIKNKITKTIDELKPYVEIGLKYIQELWDTHIEGNKAKINAAWEIIKGLFQGWFGQIQVVAGIGLGILTGDWDKAWVIMKAGFQNQWEGIKGIAQGIWDSIVGIFTEKKNTVVAIFNEMVANAKQSWLDLKSAVENNPIIQTINKVTNWISGSGSPNANGNIFSNGNIVPFATGGIVNSPTIFPMASGMGLMGEAGPEAIMPLKRNSRGQLGVMGGGGGITINITGNNLYGNDKDFANKIGDTIIKKLSNTYSFNSY